MRCMQDCTGVGMTDMLHAFDAAVMANDYTVVETVHLPARLERRETVPGGYRSGAVGRWLTRAFPGGIWSHQAEALRRFDADKNVVIATGTASGKTLVFQSAALRLLDEDPDATVLVFYPLKALVADQLVSWHRVIAAAGWKEDTVARLD